MVEGLNALGMMAGAVSIVPFLSHFFASSPRGATTVRVVFGSSVDRTTRLSGNTPGASLWNVNGDSIGYTDGSSKMRLHNTFTDLEIQSSAQAGNNQAECLSITNGWNAAIYIAGVAFTFPDGAKAGFSTNPVAACGTFWANSNTPIHAQIASGKTKKSKCIWIAEDGSNGITYQGMGLHILSFSTGDQNLCDSITENPDLLCGSGPRSRMYSRLRTGDSILVFQRALEFITGSKNASLNGRNRDLAFIIGNPGNPAGALVQKSVNGTELSRNNKFPQSRYRDSPALANSTSSLQAQSRSRRALAERLIISPHYFNSACELCESQTSYGHSFVSLQE